MLIAKKVAKDYPAIAVRFVKTDANYGLNPKVATLAGALVNARYDLVLQSDANVRVEANFLKNIVSQFERRKASLLSNIVVGEHEKSVGATMENLQLSSSIVPSVCFASVFGGVTCVIGKSMLFRRSELKQLGGLQQFKDALCEDYLLGIALPKSRQDRALMQHPGPQRKHRYSNRTNF